MWMRVAPWDRYMPNRMPSEERVELYPRGPKNIFYWTGSVWSREFSAARLHILPDTPSAHPWIWVEVIDITSGGNDET